MIFGMARPGSKSRKNSPAKPPEPVRTGYDTLGPQAYYDTHKADYRNPHEPVIVKLLGQWHAQHAPPADATMLDLACGSGEITRYFQQLGYRNLSGIDPYTGPAYAARTGLEAAALSFSDIADGRLEGGRFDYIFCSFALLLAEPSRLPVLCHRLAEAGGHMVVLTPHKRPEIRAEWGWRLEREWLSERVRLRFYRSCLIESSMHSV